MRRSRINRVPATAANTPILGPSEARVAIFFAMSASNNYAIGTDVLTAAGDGMLITNAGGPISLTIEQHGDIVKMGWNAWGVGPLTINVMETLQ